MKYCLEKPCGYYVMSFNVNLKHQLTLLGTKHCTSIWSDKYRNLNYKFTYLLSPSLKVDYLFYMMSPDGMIYKWRLMFSFTELILYIWDDYFCVTKIKPKMKTFPKSNRMRQNSTRNTQINYCSLSLLGTDT